MKRIRTTIGKILPTGWPWKAGLVFVVLLASCLWRYTHHQATYSQILMSYPALELEGHQRLLVIAPHCDDETMAAGGLLQAALARGMQVRVVVATACDGYRRGTMAKFRRLCPIPEDFIRMGEIRQQESVKALSRLGMGEGNAIYLTYPELCLRKLWWNNWLSEQPCRSPFTGFDHSTYSRSFRPNTPFSGEAMLGDLCSILHTGHPDLIILPHPNDEHIDHHTLSIFTILAVAMEQQANQAFRPEMLGYLIHYGFYPQPFGLRRKDYLRPPWQLQTIGQWLEWRLTPSAEEAKLEALKEYRSQERLMGFYLHSFVRQNELFWEMPSAASSSAFAEIEPIRESINDETDSAVDIVGLQIVRQSDRLLAVAEMRGNVSRAYSYCLYIRGFNALGSTTCSFCWGNSTSFGVKADGRTIRFPLDLNALGNPTWIAVAAETRLNITLDHSAWYLTNISSSAR